ncbi:hypothetical protein UFOVP75_170 [uncultured Caudovirales phage]|uniref:Uncharacterized protein n=1 Tax=uncultured Caudovirales phage TaxID=2100421 RepID=A0A6J5L190_9CAUD|nr:hypothetical protein UFOVP75_170 [uncultured Caudovirales phage]
MRSPSNAQSVFDRAARHLLRQNQPSTDDSDNFVYYHHPDDIRKCPVGLFINKYSPDIEGLPWGDKKVRACLEFSPSGMVVALLFALQEMHADVLVECWPDELRRIARDFHLNDHVTKEHHAVHKAP